MGPIIMNHRVEMHGKLAEHSSLIHD